MVETRTTTDPSGRVIITEHDDRGSPVPLISPQVISVLGIAAFSELLRFPLERARRGHLFISGTVSTNGSFTGQYVCIDIQVVAYIGAAATIVWGTAMDSNLNQAEFAWDQPQSYASLAIQARQVVDGLPSGVTTGIDVLSLTAAGTYWR